MKFVAGCWMTLIIVCSGTCFGMWSLLSPDGFWPRLVTVLICIPLVFVEVVAIGGAVMAMEEASQRKGRKK